MSINIIKQLPTGTVIISFSKFILCCMTLQRFLFVKYFKFKFVETNGYFWSNTTKVNVYMINSCMCTIHINKLKKEIITIKRNKIKSKISFSYHGYSDITIES